METVPQPSWADRFWRRVDKTDGCWTWTGPKWPNMGYGRFIIRRRPMVTHRLSWELAFGAIPEGSCVLHRCDNPPCLRPDHLFLGTKAENMRDMIAKGRARHQRPAYVERRLMQQAAAAAACGKPVEGDHGTNACYHRGCRCEVCVTGHRAYNREARQRWRERHAGTRISE